jgi:formate dehydrogenase maturation protein FdhE
MKTMNDLPDEQVIVKASVCKKCGSVITSAILHMMTAKTMGAFEREVAKYDLDVKMIPLLEYRKMELTWCDCK